MNPSYAFIITGRSGSGKGTQLALLSTYLQTMYPESIQQKYICGDAFRSFFTTGYPLSLFVKDSVNQGNYQPDFFATTLFFAEIFKTIQSGQIIFFDGYPRSLDQLKNLTDLLVYTQYTNVIVLDIDVSEEEVIKRMLLRGRSDDTEEGTRKRQSEYTQAVLPTIEAMKKNSYFTYVRVDGMPEPEVVHQNVLQALKTIIHG